MRIKHLASEQESTVTPEEWETIQKNGFAIDFKVLDSKPPEEVEKALKLKSEKAGSGNNDAPA